MNMRIGPLGICTLIVILILVIGCIDTPKDVEKSNENNEFNQSVKFDYSLINNTNIVYPANNSEISGLIQIITYVEICNCTGYTKLYIDGIFISNGTHNPDEPMNVTNEKWYEVFHNTLDTTLFSNDQHEIVVIGKHDQYLDQITIIVHN